MKKIKSLLFVVILILFSSLVGRAQETTTVVVRALAQDAKLIGSSMGGALITIKNAQTGELLAKGLTAGSTGDTQKLVSSPKERYEKISTEGSAKFVANIPLEKPAYVTISATGPMDYNNKKVTSSTQLWLIPGKDITGDGIILEMPGFVIDMLKPQTQQQIEEGEELTIKAHVVMMCGCSIKPGGLWDSNEMEFTALIKRGGKVVDQKPLVFTGKTSTFKTEFTPKQDGNYKIIVYGFDSRTGNTGVAKTQVTVNQ